MHVGIVGAGAVGGYLAAELSAGGAEITLVTRKGRAAATDKPVAIRADGTALHARGSLVITDDSTSLSGVDIALVTVKSPATEEVAATLAQVLPANTPVVSFQNGLRNVEILREKLGPRVAGGVVTYNVYNGERGERRQASTGKLMAGHLAGELERRMQALKEVFSASGETLELHGDFNSVLLGKLLLNLNNGICAATGLGIAASLRDYDARFCFSECILEGLDCMRRAGMKPARVTVLPPELLAPALKLPNAVVTRMARSLVGIDSAARSSTLQDIDRGRPTEIDDLNGAIVAIARRAGGEAPRNELVTRIVHEIERVAMSGGRPTFVPPRELRSQMERVSRGKHAI